MVEKTASDKEIKPPRLSRWWIIVGILAVLACVAEFSYWLAIRSELKHRASFERKLQHPAKLRGTKQITHDGLPKRNLVTDGSRLYFNEKTAAGWQVVQLSSAGGDQATALAGTVRNAKILDVSPQSELLVSTGAALKDEPQTLSPKVAPLWVISPNDSPRRLGKLSGFAGAWAPGGKVVFSNARDLYAAEHDGSNPTKIVTAPGPILGIRFSPDGSVMRLTLGILDTRYMLWQAKPDGTDIHPILPLPTLPGSDRHPLHTCCGSWTHDSKRYFYDDFDQVWVTGGGNIGVGEPVQLTSGDLHLRDPVPIGEGGTVFAIGSRASGQAGGSPADIYELDVEFH